ncbi:hypothetical protein BGZ94_001342 [Podila epigama]|nr:hypothetical protein BGZ94_001342 [Podila epigama]
MVLIAGGGIGGLTLAILLKRAGIPFLVFERASEIKTFGSAMILGTGASPLFQQLGIYDEFCAIAKHATQMGVYTDDLKLEFMMDYGWLEDITTYKEFVLSRPDLYDLLWRQIPDKNKKMNKKIIYFEQDSMKVMIRCADSTRYFGDILVGADGAYSAVRHHLYATLDAKGLLPASDKTPLPYNSICLVGQTSELSADDFPDLDSPQCQYYSILGVTSMCSWLTFTTKKNTICWMVIEFLGRESTKVDESFRGSDWGPEAVDAMCQKVRDYKVPGGKDGRVLTLADYIDRTPRENIAKVMLEEKVFETWYSDRIVLLGDACHKINPSGAAGALTAMHDAVALANWISTLRFPNVKELNTVFKEYHAERLPVARETFANSQLFTKMLGKAISFLPQIEDKVKFKAKHQPSLHKTVEILQNRRGLEKKPAPKPDGPVVFV